jgi:formiminotetrahydrofolate cyclodeaminase
VHGAFLNVKINTGGLDDTAFVQDILAKAEKMIAEADTLEAEIMGVVRGKI